MRTKTIFQQAVLAVAACAFCAGAYAGPQTDKKSNDKNQVSKQDKKWLSNAHQINVAEVKAGQLALERAHANAVRRVAQTLINDHKKLDAKVTQLAQKLGVDLPAAPSDKQKATIEFLSTKQGMAFDKEWTHTEITAHIGAITKTKAEITEGSSKKVQKAAKKAVKALKKHLSLLRTASGRIYGGP